MFSALRKLFAGAKPPSRPAPRRHMIETCPDCGAADGALHDLYCLKERCPFCGGQLASCECLGRVLQLTPQEQACVDEYVDDSVPPLSAIMQRWERALAEKGRVPFQAYRDDPYRAAFHGDLAAMRDFLDDGFAVNSANEVGYTVLMAAARGGKPAMLRLLLDRGASATAVDKTGSCSLHWIVGQPPGSADAQIAGVNLLVDAGADPNARNETGTTPLMKAAWFGCLDGARELLRRGAAPNAVDNKGRTAMSLALQRKHHDVAALLEQGADT